MSDRKITKDFFNAQREEPQVEYDSESFMAKASLLKIADLAKELHEMIEDGEDLPAWVQNKLATIEDRMSVLSDYYKYGEQRQETDEDL